MDDKNTLNRLLVIIPITFILGFISGMAFFKATNRTDTLDNRLGTPSTGFRTAFEESELFKRYERALYLPLQGKHKEALEIYLDLFEETRDVPEWYGVRLSFLLGNIEDLGKSYPPALATLKGLRDEREELIRRGESTSMLTHEYVNMNLYLNEEDRSARLLDEVTAKEGSQWQNERDDLTRLLEDR